MDGKSLDITAERLTQLRTVFPEIFSEDKIDFQRLKQAIGEDAFVNGEHYELSWAGKSEARKEVQKQTTATLIPNKENNIDLDSTQNIFIEGENLEVLRVLQKSYFGKIKMIYIDPPYNTGNDSFVYPDDYSERQEEYKKRTGISNDNGFLNKQDLWKKNTKENGHFHSVWLSMMYPRLYLSRNLLQEDGVIFISIDDNEVNNLKLICDEIFGEDNFVSCNVWKKKQGGGNDSKYFVVEHEYILCYSKNIQKFYLELDKDHELNDNLYPFKDELGEYGLVTLDKSSIQFSESLVFDIIDNEGNIYKPRIIKGKQSCWRWGKKKVKSDFDKLVFKNGNVYTKYYRQNGVKPKSLLHEARFGRTETGKEEISSLLGQGDFSYPKPLNLIKHFINITCKATENHIILDFFAGSGTTAQAIMELNEEDGGDRQYICVQMPEATDENNEAYKIGYKTIADITRARIEKAIKKIKEHAIENEQKLHFNQNVQTEEKVQLKELLNSAQLDMEGNPTLSKQGQKLQKNIEKREINIESLIKKQKIYESLNLRCGNYTLAPSNFKIWRNELENKAAIASQLELHLQSEKQGSEKNNMFIELCLKGGLGLNTNYILQDDFYKTNQSVWFCFESYNDNQKQVILNEMPQKVIYLNSSFKSDMDLTNFQLELKENQIELTVI